MLKTWAVPAAIIVGVEYLFAWLIGLRVGFHYHIPFGAYLILGSAFAGLGASLVVVSKLCLYALQGESRPSRRLVGEIPYLTAFVVAVLLYALQLAVLSWAKVMLPIASPFWADPLLANLDHLIFGVDPWIAAHALFGWAEPVIDRVYVTWAPLKMGTILFLALSPGSDWKAKSLISAFLMMAIAVLGQYVLSSAGPVFFDQLGYGPRFQAMPIEPWVLEAKNFLWRDYLRSGGDIGAGISAMPSVHVAGALWIALVWSSYKPRIRTIAFLYFALIAIGSVLLGWHYALDGIAGALVTLAAWKAAGPIALRNGSSPEVALPALAPSI